MILLSFYGVGIDKYDEYVITSQNAPRPPARYALHPQVIRWPPIA